MEQHFKGLPTNFSIESILLMVDFCHLEFQWFIPSETKTESLKKKDGRHFFT